MSGVWSERPTGESNRSRSAAIARRFTSSGGHGYFDVHCRIDATSEPASRSVPTRALDVLDARTSPWRRARASRSPRSPRRAAGSSLRRTRSCRRARRPPRGARPPRRRTATRRRGGRAPRRRLQREVVVLRQLHALRELVPRLVEVRRRRRRGKHLRVRDVGLELHGVGAGFRGSVERAPLPGRDVPSWLLPISATISVGLPGPSARPAKSMKGVILAAALSLEQEAGELEIALGVDVERPLRRHRVAAHVVGDQATAVDHGQPADVDRSRSGPRAAEARATASSRRPGGTGGAGRLRAASASRGGLPTRARTPRRPSPLRCARAGRRCRRGLPAP